MMDYLDIIIYAVIAILLLARLWFMFGRRNDEDRQPSNNPFPTPQPLDDSGPVIVPGSVRGQKADAAARPFAPIDIAPASLLGALDQIGKLDPAFDEKKFLRDTRQIFSEIVEDFARGDLTRSMNHLSPQVAERFKAAIAARATAGETVGNKILRISDIEVTAARTEGTRALLTVRIVSEQENIVRDASGKITAGEVGQPEEITDIWVFARDTAMPKSEWQLTET